MLKHLALLTVTVLAFSGAASMPVTAQGENLPIRTIPRPATTTGVPHVQIDVVPQPDLAAALLSRVAELPDIEIRETVISLPGAKGFWRPIIWNSPDPRRLSAVGSSRICTQTAACTLR